MLVVWASATSTAFDFLADFRFRDDGAVDSPRTFLQKRRMLVGHVLIPWCSRTRRMVSKEAPFPRKPLIKSARGRSTAKDSLGVGPNRANRSSRLFGSFMGWIIDWLVADLRTRRGLAN